MNGLAAGCGLVGRIFLGLALGLLVPGARADDVQPATEKKPDPPQLLLALPLAVTSGSTNTLQLRGLNLTNVTELRWTNAAAGASCHLQSASRADVPKEFDAKKVGDTKLDAQVYLRETAVPGTNWLLAISPSGESAPLPVLVLPPGSIADEREPNAGLQDAPMLAPGWIRGLIQESGDVDVFRFSIRPGQRLRAEVYASPGGSPLDSLLTIYDAAGNILASNDDATAGQRDSRVEIQFKAGGLASLCIQDANDKGSLAHAYVVRARIVDAEGAKGP